MVGEVYIKVGTESEQAMRVMIGKHSPGLCKRLTTEQLAHVSPHFVHDTHAPAAAIIRQGDPLDGSFIPDS